MGNAINAIIDRHNENDPNKVMVPPNLGGFNRVIISLPDELSIDDILNDLVEEGYLNGIEEHEKVEKDHFVVKCKNETETANMMTYLNNKFGYIAHKGYVKPSRNIVIDENKYGGTTAEVNKSTHIALVQAPDAKNPNEQFSAYRREFDPESEFPKFERVDIEKIIHYTRPEDIANKNIHGFTDPMADTQNNAMLEATNALNAMTKGVQFDITDTEAVKDRDAVKIDYVEKIRKLRLELSNSRLRTIRKPRIQKRICEQFKYDHMNNLIELKRKKYGINRAKRIYELQRQERLTMAKMKQEIDPNYKPSEYNKQQKSFWQEFDYVTK